MMNTPTDIQNGLDQGCALLPFLQNKTLGRSKKWDISIFDLCWWFYYSEKYI